MTEQEKLARTWVEVREESEPGRIVLRPVDYNLPPARGRRWLDLSEPTRALAKSPGPADKMEGKSGTWSVSDQELSITAPGWTGTYHIEEVGENLLVLRPK
jgi:hypothetical protein